jgi:PqqD family protein of HPr-rel-A system
MWQIREADILSEQCDKVSVVFQRSSGKTHFLNETSAFILELLREAACDFSAICDRLMAEVGIPLSDNQLLQLRGHLERLDALGLIERSDRVGLS